MWVRSQDKMTLIDAEVFQISVPYTLSEEAAFRVCTYFDNVEYTLGVYKEKEQALKVMFDMQYVLEYYEGQNVFDMPEEGM